MYKYVLAIKYLLNRPINLIGAIGITISVWALILVIGIFTGYIGEMVKHIRASASDLSFLFPQSTDSFTAYRSVITDARGVTAVAPRMAWYGMLVPEQRKRRAPGTIDPATTAGKPVTNFFQVVGIDAPLENHIRDFKADLDQVVDPKLRVPDPDAPFALAASPGGDDLPGIILGLSRVGPDGWGIERGSIVTLTSAKPRPPGSRDPIETVSHRFRLAGAFKSRYFEFEHGTAFVDIGVMRSRFPSRLSGAEDGFNEIAIRVSDTEDLDAVAVRVREHLEAANLYGRVVTWKERPKFARFLENVRHQRALMRFVLGILMVVSCFLIFATLLMMVSEKTRDIGIIASLGATRSGVLGIFMICGLAIAVSGVVCGALASWITSAHLNDINDWITTTFHTTLFPRSIYGLDRVPYEVDVAWTGGVIAAAVVLTVVASLIPASIAARLDPIQALRRE